MTYISRFDLGFLSPYSFELKGPFQYASLFDSTNYSSSSIEFEIWIKTSVSLQDKVYGIVVKDNAFGLYLCNGILMTYNFITNEKTFGNFKCIMIILGIE